MWQKIDENSKDYHLIITTADGIVTSACGETMPERRDLQVEHWMSIYGHDCRTCNQVCNIVFTSVVDAMDTIKRTDDQRVIQGALALARQKPSGMKTLVRMLEAREKILQKNYAQEPSVCKQGYEMDK